MNATAEAWTRARMRFSRALQPVRNAKYFATRWARRKLTAVPGVEPRPLTQASLDGVTIVRRFNPAGPSLPLPRPKDLAGECDRFFRKRPGIPVFERYLARIAGARIHGPDGFLYLPDGRVLLDHHFNFRDYIENHDLYFASLPEPRLIEGPVFPMIGFCPGAHYHWMTEVLYRLHGCLELLPPETKFLLPARALAVHREALRAFGIGPGHCLEMQREDHFKFTDLWYAPPVTRSGYDIPEVARWVRDRLAAHAATHAPDRATPGPAAVPEAATTKVYITRRRATKRRTVNEPELIRDLNDAGFVCVECEKLDYFAQAELFSRAREIVAPHGAGLVNLLFTQPGGRVLEIFPEEIPLGGTCYWSLAHALDWDYAYVRGSISGRAQDQSDMSVPLDLVRTWLAAADARTDTDTPRETTSP